MNFSQNTLPDNGKWLCCVKMVFLPKLISLLGPAKVVPTAESDVLKT